MAKTQSTTQNTQTEPWGPSQSYLKDYLAQAASIFGGGGGSGGPGKLERSQAGDLGGNIGGGIGMFTPTQSDWTKQANEMVARLAGQGTPGIDAANSALTGILSGSDPTSQYLDKYASGAYVNGGSPEFLKALDLQAGNAANDAARYFSNSGRLGSNAAGNSITTATGNVRTQAMADEIAREQALQLQAAGMLSGNKLSAAGMAPGLESAKYLPSQMLGAVGAGQDNFDWRVKQAPYEALKAYGGILGPIAGAGGSSNTTVTQPYSPFMSMLGGGLGILQLLSGFGR